MKGEKLLNSKKHPNTKEGNNWTVVAFKCPKKNWTETLSSLFSELDKQKEPLIPHYTIRSCEPITDSLIISFRILRKQEDEEKIKSLIQNVMKGYSYEIDPKKGSQFYNFHRWINHGNVKEHWTEERCQILSKLSRFALEIINSKTNLEDRIEWAHLFSNMIDVFDWEKIIRSSETYPNFYPPIVYHN